MRLGKPSVGIVIWNAVIIGPDCRLAMQRARHHGTAS